MVVGVCVRETIGGVLVCLSDMIEDHSGPEESMYRWAAIGLSPSVDVCCHLVSKSTLLLPYLQHVSVCVRVCVCMSVCRWWFRSRLS